jgi:hypothetical protein
VRTSLYRIARCGRSPDRRLALERPSGTEAAERKTSKRSAHFPHVAMVHSGNLTVVPDDRERIPPRFGYSASQTRLPFLRFLDSPTFMARLSLLAGWLCTSG